MTSIDLTIPAFLDRTGLPGMVDRAAATLASAKTAAEVLEARDMASVAYDTAKRAARLASAQGAFNEIRAKITRAQAEALEIEAAANRRLADEYDAAQERGELAKPGNPNLSGSEKLASGPAIIPPKQLHEARIIRDAEEAHPGIVKETIEAAVAAGEEPTRAKVRRAALKSAGRKPKQRRQAARPAVEETQHDRDVRMLLGVWEAACETARVEFLSTVTNQN